MSSPAETAAASTPAHVLFVTGKLAEPSLRRVLDDMAAPFRSEVAVMGITVAALMTTPWMARFLKVPPGVDLVMVPGLCEGDLDALAGALGVAVARGPADLRDIPEYFGRQSSSAEYGAWDIEIVAEINNAPTRSREAIHREAEHYRQSGADVIDIGCTPGVPFSGLAEIVRELTSAGLHVSIDTFEADEIRAAIGAGAELVLSVNTSNLEIAREFGGSNVRFVVIPDLGGTLDTLWPSVERLSAWNVRYLVDPILDPIGHGFAQSLERYAVVRRRLPEAEMLMGIGNVTELTAADTTGTNAVLIAVCQELGIRSVLTTEVIPWARGVVREVAIARQLMHYAITHQAIPKGVDDRLVTVKDPRVLTFTEGELRSLQQQITDPNFRIFADSAGITVLNNERFVRGTDIDRIFGELDVEEPTHAFYLGQELARASLAVSLGKTYRQDGTLNWGYLTPAERPETGRVKLTQSSRRPHDAGASGSPGQNGA